ncbi:hypothetical protein H0E87_015500 [Populus deltoides]|uniref:Tetratricopeptide repeat-like superfamily protein n=1 Tax=Populus deltoides TaxID=3696 RepID=A0A8T2Y5A6_POPDE|nr:hypothetical protein H0E87_015500 [Populus deltoides]
MVSDAEDLVPEMDEKVLEIDGYTRSALTRMYIEAGMREFSWLWFRRFHLTGNMSFECYSASIDAYGKHCHILEAEKVFVRCTYSSIIQISAGADLPDKAKHYLKKMQEAGPFTDCISYCALISRVEKIGKLEIAEDLHYEMIGFDVKPDVVVYGVLINTFADAESVKEALGYKRLGRFEEAIQIAKQTRVLVLLTDLLCYNNVLGLYALDGRWKEAVGTFKEMVEASIQPDDYMFNSLGIALVKCGISKKAVDKLEATKKNDYQNGLQAWILGLSTVADVHDDYDE